MSVPAKCLFFLVSGLSTYPLAQFVLESLMLLRLQTGWEVFQAFLFQEQGQHCAKIDRRLVQFGSQLPDHEKAATSVYGKDENSAKPMSWLR